MDEKSLGTLLQLISGWQVVLALLVVAGAWLSLVVLRIGIEHLGSKLGRRRLYIIRIFPLIRLLVWITAALVIVRNVLALSGELLLALSASVGIAIGLAAQDVLKNMLAGVIMIFDRPFRVGDMVNIGDRYGEVLSIDLHVTRLRTFNDDVVTVPNAEIYKLAIANSNAGEITEMISVPIYLDAAADVEQARRIAIESARCSPFTYLKKPVNVVVEDTFDQRQVVRLQVKAYVVDVRWERLMASDITRRIRSALLDAMRAG